MAGANISALLGPPVLLEGLGYGLRNVMANHVVAITNKNTLNAAALSSIMEQTAMFETGDASGAFERMHLLTLAYQGLNADNLVFDLVKENVKGTVGTVIQSLVGRAIEDNVIKASRKMTLGLLIMNLLIGLMECLCCCRIISCGLLLMWVLQELLKQLHPRFFIIMIYWNMKRDFLVLILVELWVLV